MNRYRLWRDKQVAALSARRADEILRFPAVGVSAHYVRVRMVCHQ